MTFLLAGCGADPCVEYCKQLDAWLDDCGTTWESHFPGGQLDSLDDCYDHYWNAEAGKERQCQDGARDLKTAECY